MSMGVWRAPTLRSLIEVLDRVIGRGVVIDSDVPVSPVLAGLRRAAALDEQEVPGTDEWAPPAPQSPAEEVRDPWWRDAWPADEDGREPPRRGGLPLD